MAEDHMNVPASDLPPPEKKEHGDFRSSFHWRVFRIMAEFVDGWQFLADFKNTVTIFGSARFEPGTEYYEKAVELGRVLGEAGYGVVTGGGPGIMEAGNKGVDEGGGDSIGLNIRLPYEQRMNEYVKKSTAFHYFFVRKVMLVYSAQAYVYFPGGFGTLDEFFELVTLIQTKKIPTHIPVICFGKKFWEPLADWIKNEVYAKFAAIDKEDMNIFTIVDTAEEALAIIKKAPPRSEFSV